MKPIVLQKTRSRGIFARNVFSAMYVPVFLAALLVLLMGAPRLPAQTPSGKDVVAPSAYVSLDPAGRGSTAQIAVVMKIRPGFHVNAREKSAEYLIATDLKSNLPAGFSAGDVAYPKGRLEKFVFSKTPLNVYQDTVILKMPLNVLATAPTGEQHIPLKLRYQACSQEICLPPVTLDVDAVVNVAASASASTPAHLEFFATQK
jgi:thiol:disulfide interchange protein DsbD